MAELFEIGVNTVNHHLKEIYDDGELDRDGRRVQGVTIRSSRPFAIAQALAGERPAFEWTHRHISGRLVPCEVRLVRLPAGERRLVRGSVLDNTERYRRERVQQATFAISQAVLETQDLPSLFVRLGRLHQLHLRLELTRRGIGRFQAPADVDMQWLSRVHDVGYLQFLQSAWDDWLALYTEDCEFWVPAWKSEDTPTADPGAEVAGGPRRVRGGRPRSRRARRPRAGAPWRP